MDQCSGLGGKSLLAIIDGRSALRYAFYVRVPKILHQP